MLVVGIIASGYNSSANIDPGTFSSLVITPSPDGTGSSNLSSGFLSFTVPNTYTIVCNANVSISVEIDGAGGARGVGGVSFAGGIGGKTTGSVSLEQGKTYIMVVGGGSTNSTASIYGGGGNSHSVAAGGAGGGYSGFFVTSISHANSIIIAGGGGGGPGNDGLSTNGIGGSGGGNTAGNSSSASGGQGGSQIAGGDAGTSNVSITSENNGGATAGSQLFGGLGGVRYPNRGSGGGGGGGYYGGGGGSQGGFGTLVQTGQGGGGGSGYIGGHSNAIVTNAFTTAGRGSATNTNGAITIVLNTFEAAEVIAVSHNRGTDLLPGISVYGWSNSGFGSKFNDAASPILSGSGDNSFNLSGNTLLITGGVTSPRIHAYQWSIDGFGSKYSDPATLPTGSANQVDWHPSGLSFVFTSSSTSPYIQAYSWSEVGFGTKYSNPASAVPNLTNQAKFSPSGKDVAVGHASSPFISVYKWTNSSGFGTLYGAPSTVVGLVNPTATGSGITDLDWHPSGSIIGLVSEQSASGPLIQAYGWNGGFTTRFATTNIASPTGNGVKFNPQGTAIAVTSSSFTRIDVYSWSSAGFGSKFSNPGTLPSGNGKKVEFSPDGAQIGIVHEQTPYITTYPWTEAGFGTKYSDPSPGFTFNPSGTASQKASNTAALTFA